MKKILKALENIIYALATIIIYTSGSIPLMIVGLPILLVTSSKILNIVNQNKIENSIFSVSKKGQIKQNSLANPIHLIKILFSKNKDQVFINEAEKMFMQLPRTDSNGQTIKYNTVSHGLTYKLLKQLENDNHITNLTREKIAPKKLFFEKILIGNTNKINKKHQMYKIEFELTDKRYGNKDKQNIKENETPPKNTTRKQIQELNALKRQILNKQAENHIKNETNTRYQRR